MTKTNIKVLYEDNHIIVIEKPVNIPSQADKSKDDDMLTIVKKYVKDKYEKPGDVYIGLVHRLDRPVGGIIVFARTSKAASRLSEQIRKREFEKGYLAVLNGTLLSAEGTLKHHIKKDTATNKVSIVAENTENAKKALLHYTVLERAQGLSFVYINLYTGRPHQIRAQFAAIGHALYGDIKYGKPDKASQAQLALWSFEIGFEHPTKKQKLRFRSLPPFDKYPWNIFSTYAFVAFEN